MTGDAQPPEKSALDVFPFDLGRGAFDESRVHLSSVPPPCLSEPVILGVDEAGRGPVLGPMVYSAAYCPSSRTDSLKEMGFADSKTLSEEERERLFVNVADAQEWLGWAMHALHPEEISNSMLRRNKYNLNALAHDTTAALIRAVLDRGVQLEHVYIDTVGPPDAYQRKLQALFPTVRITVSKKADSIYPIVSAASICAKVPRDLLLSHWSYVEAESLAERMAALGDAGSGYPGDERTVSWLRRALDPVFGFPALARFSWGTVERLLDDRGVAVVWPEAETGPAPPSKKRAAGKPRVAAAVSVLHRAVDGPSPSARAVFAMRTASSPSLFVTSR